MASQIRCTYQAHRGSTEEAPENTMAAFVHAWRFPGAIPETDVRTTADGALICLHDSTLARTTDAPDQIRHRNVATLDLAQIRRCDAGIRFGSRFAGQQVPILAELLHELKRQANRRLYLEVKAVDLDILRQVVGKEDVASRLLFVSGERETLLALRERFPSVPTMTWVGGAPEQIRQGFRSLAAAGFQGISQLQLHLPVASTEPAIGFGLDRAFLREAQSVLADARVELLLRPFAFDGPSLCSLLDLGVRWFVTDAPERFSGALADAMGGS